jgi:hypothetical protein
LNRPAETTGLSSSGNEKRGIYFFRPFLNIASHFSAAASALRAAFSALIAADSAALALAVHDCSIDWALSRADWQSSVHFLQSSVPQQPETIVKANATTNITATILFMFFSPFKTVRLKSLCDFQILLCCGFPTPCTWELSENWNVWHAGVYARIHSEKWMMA